MKKVSIKKISRGLLSALVVVFFLISCISCSDEPEVHIDYYLSVRSNTAIFNHEGELPLDSEMARIGNAIRMMQDKIKEAYPEKTVEGNDGAVISACTNVYFQFRLPDDADVEHAICTATLYRAVVSDGIIRGNKRLVTFTFG